MENQSCIETAASATCSTIGLCFHPISTKQEWNCYTSPKVPTDVRCGVYLLEKALAYSGKKLFAGLKSSMQEQLKKACEYIKKAFRIEWGKTGQKSPKNMSEDRFKSQGWRKPRILGWRSNLASRAPLGTAQSHCHCQGRTGTGHAGQICPLHCTNQQCAKSNATGMAHGIPSQRAQTCLALISFPCH